jgi:hypothetical protein
VLVESDAFEFSAIGTVVVEAALHYADILAITRVKCLRGRAPGAALKGEKVIA